ncbi:hypothetical protein [Streptomyces sp. BE133]|uniref:hypothetical protein n=1 Tax=Streptomyces sp. BE133 TaxID=3002523 RepID=UPI002E75CBA0|nr:hypothetical protein [Streptomyces sp. BE133]MEE1811721.1 hypothetical protein [Streptomyces sp. BE133]
MPPSAARPLALLFGGAVVHLADRAWYHRVITHRARAERLIACAALRRLRRRRCRHGLGVSLAVLDVILVVVVVARRPVTRPRPVVSGRPQPGVRGRDRRETTGAP